MAVFSWSKLFKIEHAVQGWTGLLNDNTNRLDALFLRLAALGDYHNPYGTLTHRDVLLWNQANQRWEIRHYYDVFPTTTTSTFTTTSTTTSSISSTSSSTSTSSSSSTSSTSASSTFSTGTTYTGYTTQSTTSSSSSTSSTSSTISTSSSSSTTTAPPTKWNSSDKGSLLGLSDGDLTATRNAGSDGYQGVRSIVGRSSGKWYWEYTMTQASSANFAVIGVGNSSQSLTNYIGNSTNGWGYYQTNGNKVYNGTETSYGASFTTNDVIGVALDMDNGKVWFRKNGTWQNSGDPSAGTGEAFSGLSGTIYAMVSIYYHGDSITANFGASAFRDSAPSGFNSGLW